MADPDAYPRIEDYALIGDCGSAALIARDGGIDWLCWPQFNSTSIFGALLDRRIGGTFYIRPTADYEVRRRYVGHTNVLETTFVTDTGTLQLVDCMPVSTRERYHHALWPDHEVLRCFACTDGEVEVDILCDPRMDYGRVQPRMEDRGALGYFYNYGSEVLVLRSEVPLTLSDDGGVLSGRATLHAGDRRRIALTYDLQEPAVLPVLGEAADARVQETLDYWREWIQHCVYEGPYQDVVYRSLLALKLMTYARSGAIVAAPTTSLPEELGGSKNWDYRFCWLRDAAFSLRVFFSLGYEWEGQAFFSWILHATGGAQPELNIMYDVFGGTCVDEIELDHLAGYEHSKPVRIGNGAQDQFQLDMYGEIAVSAREYVRRDGGLDRAESTFLRKLGETICERWQEPDNGIWEVRGGRQRHTYSNAMCWVGLESLLQLHEHGDLEVPAERFRRVRDEIREAVETHGYNEDLQTYTATFGGDRVDASLLLMAVYGYCDPASERMQNTFRCIQERLGRDGLLYRYLHRNDDGELVPEEGAFGICSFWDEAYLALLGKVDEAKAHFEDMMQYANDVGLFAEEIDPETGRALGNFPQAFTHVGLINAALTIAQAEGAAGEEEGMEQSLDADDA